jgi:hypothetical protein
LLPASTLLGRIERRRRIAGARECRSRRCQHWFLQEQREEVSSMSALLPVVRRAGDNLLLVEDFLSRNQVGDAGEAAAAPPAAGGAL